MRVGDVVRLKSGGPDMTVAELGMPEGEPRVWCEWFSGTEKRCAPFHPEMVVPCES